MKSTLTLALALTMAATCGSLARAASIFSPGSLTPGFSTIDFESIPTGTLFPAPGTFSVGPVTFSSTAGQALRITGTFAFPGADPAGNHLSPSSGTFGDVHPLRFDFASPVAEFLVTWIDPNFANNFLHAYSTSGTLLESVEVPATGSGTSAFAGIVRPSQDISYVVTQVAPGDLYLLDNVRYGAMAVVPEPQSVVLLATGIAGMLGLGWRRRAKRSAKA